MNKSESLNELAAALAKAQAAVKGAVKDATNPHFKSKYADLASVWDACREALSQNGLSVVQLPGRDGTEVSVETILMHSSGQWIAGSVSTPVARNDAQGVGSAITYLRRYSLAAAVGIAPEDDDGESAIDRSAPQRAQPKLVAPVQKAPPHDPVTGEVTDEPKYAAWVRTAEAEIAACTSQAAVDAWEERNKVALDRLKALNPDERLRLGNVMAQRWQDLTLLGVG